MVGVARQVWEVREGGDNRLFCIAFQTETLSWNYLWLPQLSRCIRVSKAGSSYRVTKIPVEALRQIPVGIITPARLQ